MVTEEQCREALRDCYDPEIPINIVDLGLIYNIAIDGGRVEVKMTLTAVGCPVGFEIQQQVKNTLESLDGIEEAEVELVWDPQWDPSMMSEEGKEQMRAMGFSV